MAVELLQGADAVKFINDRATDLAADIDELCVRRGINPIVMALAYKLNAITSDRALKTFGSAEQLYAVGECWEKMQKDFEEAFPEAVRESGHTPNPEA